MKHSEKDRDDDDAPSLSLWVGNLPPGHVESELTSLFGKFGVLESVIAYATRNYAFVNFKRLDDAKAAKEALQRSVLRGSVIKIEFSRAAKPCRNLWIGGISPSISKEQLENELSKFGQIEDFKFLRDRNTALINFYKIDDASSALKNMNGKIFGGEQLRVDYLRSQPQRRDWVDHHNHHDPRDHSTWLPPEPMRNFTRFPLPMERRDIQSKTLWIGYPPSVQIDEQMLHNAMILFGEIDDIQCFPMKHYSIVEFRSVDEARRAKEGLQGRLFNDPRIQILFSTGGDSMYSGNDGFFQAMPPPPHPDFSFHGPPMGGLPRRTMMHGGFGPLDRLSSPQPEFFPRLSPPPDRFAPGIWEEMDWRERKRMRIAGDPMGVEAPHGVVNVRYDDGDRKSPVVRRDLPGRDGGGSVPTAEHVWQGVIAKGGTPICSVLCLPLGKGIESPFPKMINCTAKTGLDTLAKHCKEAAGFNTVFFLPDSKEDFSPYTDFLQYLSQNNRAGVAKLVDGATMFLVPPSSFLSSFLSISSPNRLYGIVFHLSPPPSPPIPAAKTDDVKLTPELIATLSMLLPGSSSVLSSIKPMAQIQSILRSMGQPEIEEKSERYPSMPMAMARHSNQREMADEKDQRYEAMLKSKAGSGDQWAMDDERNRMGYSAQHRFEDEKNQGYQSLMKSTTGYAGQWDTMDETNQIYQSTMASKVGYAGQHRLEDEKKPSYELMTKSTMGSSGQREADEGNNQRYQSMLMSAAGGQRGIIDEGGRSLYDSMMKSTPVSSTQQDMENDKGQRYQSMIQSTEDGRNQWYRSMLTSTVGPAIKKEMDDENSQRFPSTMKSTVGPTVQQPAENERNQRYQLAAVSSLGNASQQETDDEKKKKYQSTLQFAANLLLQIQKQQQSAQGGGNPS